MIKVQKIVNVCDGYTTLTLSNNNIFTRFSAKNMKGILRNVSVSWCNRPYQGNA